MYGYEYGYEPAYEAAGFFNAVRDLIRNTQEKIRDFMEKVKAKLRRLTKNKDQMVEDTARAREIIKALGGKIKALLDDCGNAIDDIYRAFAKNSKTSKDVEGDDTTKIIDARAGGMDKFKAKDDASKKAWEEERIRLGKTFAEQGAEAEKIAKDIKELNSLGTLSYDATSQGYTELRDIFSANGRFGDGWKKVQIAADWATGAIKESLNKVISLYKVGVKATNAFGNRLIRGDYRDESGEKLSKEDRKAKMNADKNMVKIHREDKDQFNISTKSKDLREYKVVVEKIKDAGDEVDDAAKDLAEAYRAALQKDLDDNPKFKEGIRKTANQVNANIDKAIDAAKRIANASANPNDMNPVINILNSAKFTGEVTASNIITFGKNYSSASDKLAGFVESMVRYVEEQGKTGKPNAVAKSAYTFVNVTVQTAEYVEKAAVTLKAMPSGATIPSNPGNGNESIDSAMFYDADFFEPAYETFDDFDDDFDLDIYDYDDFEYSHSGSMFDEDFFD